MKRKAQPGARKPGTRPKEPRVERLTYGAQGRFWISANGHTFLGYGRAILLARIKEHGSITKAGASMGMAYRHAWELVDSMNALSPKPLVVTAVGGRNGGGSTLTPEGERAVEFFWGLHASFKKFLSGFDKHLDALYEMDTENQ